ncbi:Tenascin-R,Techylectin-5B,Fibrinogen C domain-containing protein 1-A,Fibrinogen C domain-containing protein 1,Fibrinogen C domain-containing protein 1-B,Ficolin-2,Tenascin,Ficolin-1,Microfibril-associated glycoprotein 4,Techylectin-5A [Mytilus edulis]|uniref:Uncharacterized protein n=1 Tax=Mytilus edulis TaxID=6550 RepID=A0A8S3T8P9_MYTED|nr:Tenascin-R,Techylectin-5B,Fibrinogen C domain-containing protein 1-A,Fibrinogen C domain-containing protein 1,Fibrinogen C domain-containing protein 1-B,Ficolin-2,Tenascin,Ficolin-1,Microfibril-associated glycoprotein 4,Techylectin-5A [Mytilus edulis]
METTEVSQGGRRKWLLAASVILFSTIAFLISKTSCKDGHCYNGGTCIEVGESFKCLCPFGYNGSNCRNSSCSTEPCLNNGSCTVNGTSYVCSCQDGYNGTQCEETPCSNQPCLNNGSCEILEASYVCFCPDGYNGTNCEDSSCSSEPCFNNGSCIVKGTSYVCSCQDGYNGTQCEDNLPFCCKCGMENDCADNTTCASGTYELHLTNIFEVYCDMEIDNSGLEQIHEITKEGNYMLRIDLEDFEGETRYALYSNFLIENASSEYTLRVSGYSGTAGDAMAFHNDMHFSTKDRGDKIACTTSYKGAWWYGHCHHSNLNGLYLNGSHFSHANGINWLQWKGHYYFMKTSKMMVRRKN